MISIRDLRFSYPGGLFELALDRLEVPEGGTLCITGPSGSGKTTLINLISGILEPTAGSIRIAGLEITRKNEKSVRSFRLEKIGFVFQDFKLLEYLTVEQNILLPYLLSSRMKADDRVRERLAVFVEKTGIEGKLKSFPGHLSHGEKQRVAVLRALITLPSLVIGDEPTANLDRENAEGIMELISGLAEENNATFVMVTHDEPMTRHFKTRLNLGGPMPGTAEKQQIGHGQEE